MKLSTWLFSAFAGLAVAACGQNAGSGKTLEPMTMGDPNAPAKLVEYASVTCTHCANYHEEVFQQLKPRIEAGELYYEFREFPTAPEKLAFAGFKLVRCAGDDRYFDVMDDLFANQIDILTAAQQGKAAGELFKVAKKYGMNEEEFNACIQNQEIHDHIEAVMTEGQKLGVNSTPSFFMNDEKLAPNTAWDVAAMNLVIDELNNGGGAPAATPAPETTEAVEPPADETTPETTPDPVPTSTPEE